MRFTFWQTRASRTIGQALVGVALLVAPIQAQTYCQPSSPSFRISEGMARFAIELHCGNEGERFPLRDDVIAGLTVYADPRSTAAPATADANDARAEAPKKLLLTDESTESVDLEPQTVRITSRKSAITVRFAIPKEKIENMRYMVFAFWNKNAKATCDREEAYARTGCKQFGYVIGPSIEEDLIVGYPGLERVEETDSAGYPIETVKWWAEAFR